MSTEMRIRLSVKEYVLVVMTLTLLPILLVELYGISLARINNKAFQDDTPGMPQFTDLLIGGAVSLMLMGVRCITGKAFLPLGKAVLSPQKRVVEVRVHRFTAVSFKLM